MLAEDAAKAARRHVADPAIKAAHRANEAARAAYQDTRERVAGHMADAERAAEQQRDRAADWISGNPFAAIAAAFGAGLLFFAFFGRSSHR